MFETESGINEMEHPFITQAAYMTIRTRHLETIVLEIVISSHGLHAYFLYFHVIILSSVQSTVCDTTMDIVLRSSIVALLSAKALLPSKISTTQYRVYATRVPCQ